MAMAKNMTTRQGVYESNDSHCAADRVAHRGR
jgi:hypothetical protein